MGGHHGDSYTIPDYKIYKVENVPKLMETQRALHAKGLHDPWLRNEVWRYNTKQFGTVGTRARQFFLRGFRPGIIALIATIILTPVYNIAFPSKHHGEHHDKKHGVKHGKKTKSEVDETSEIEEEKKNK